MSTEDDPPEEQPHDLVSRHPFRDAGHRIAEAAIDAELHTGRREETVEQARAGALRRTARATGGFLVIGMGIALLPLPGPGWVVIIIGLSMLPFAWAERTILAIRRRVPGVPEEGRIPVSTWIVMGLMLATASAVFILFGGAIGDWLGDRWAALWN